MAEVEGEAFFERGNEAAIMKRLDEALECYTKAIEKDPDNPAYIFERSSVYLSLQKYYELKRDACKLLDMKCSDDTKSRANFRKGIACFHLQEYQEALEAFMQCQRCVDVLPECDGWIEKCKNKLQEKEDIATPSVQVPSTPSSDNIRYDWYQTEAHVVINILLKKLKENDVLVEFQESSVSCYVKLSSSSEYSLNLDLAHRIVPDRSLYKVMPSKIEVKMLKKEGIRWVNLERDPELTPSAACDQSNVTKYPSSRQEKVDWDKLVVDIKKEEAEEKLEGEAALNQLFQKIYSDGSDEVKKAMNKSFMESGGTVLSTNWNEVGNKKVEMKPPEGMEWKQWD